MSERGKKMGMAILIALILSGTVGGPSTAFGQGESVTLRVQGMVCFLCERAVESALRDVEGVVSADASFISGKAVVEYDPHRVAPSQLVEAVNAKTLYRASLPSADTETEGVTDKGGNTYALVLEALKYGVWGLLALLVGIVSWWAMRRKRGTWSGGKEGEGETRNP